MDDERAGVGDGRRLNRASADLGRLLSMITATSFLMFVTGYIYLFVNDREALRAERWRTRPRDKSREVTRPQQQQLGESEPEYLEPEPQASTVPLAVAGPRIRVDAGRATRD